MCFQVPVPEAGSQRRLTAKISTRVRANQKLGIAWDQVPGLVRQLRADGARVEGLHCHTGSGGRGLSVDGDLAVGTVQSAPKISSASR